MNAVEIEAKIARLKEAQKKHRIEEGGGNYLHEAEYFNIEVKIDRLYDQLDEMECSQ